MVAVCSGAPTNQGWAFCIDHMMDVPYQLCDRKLRSWERFSLAVTGESAEGSDYSVRGMLGRLGRKNCAPAPRLWGAVLRISVSLLHCLERRS
jgi:hypothetical protein